MRTKDEPKEFCCGLDRERRKDRGKSFQLSTPVFSEATAWGQDLVPACAMTMVSIK
jgi:hypothetical protein